MCGKIGSITARLFCLCNERLSAKEVTNLREAILLVKPFKFSLKVLRKRDIRVLEPKKTQKLLNERFRYKRPQRWKSDEPYPKRTITLIDCLKRDRDTLNANMSFINCVSYISLLIWFFWGQQNHKAMRGRDLAISGEGGREGESQPIWNGPLLPTLYSKPSVPCPFAAHVFIYAWTG